VQGGSAESCANQRHLDSLHIANEADFTNSSPAVQAPPEPTENKVHHQSFAKRKLVLQL
jgi:hypothetical protein